MMRILKRITNLAIKENRLKEYDGIINDLIYHVNDNLKKVVYNFYGSICLECHELVGKLINN